MAFWQPFSTLEQGAVYKGVQFGFVDSQKYLAVVVTPRCDIEHKADYVTLLPAIPAHVVLPHWVSNNAFDGIQPEHLSGQIAVSKKKLEALKKSFRNLYLKWHQRDAAARYHFLPAYGSHPPTFVDFQAPHSFTKGNSANWQGIGRIASPYIEHLLSRYVSMTGRVGVDGIPDVELNQIIDSLTSFKVLENT